MRTAHSLLLLLVLSIAGCSVGVKVEDFEPAQGPHGVQMELKLNGNVIDGNKISGELLAVREDGVLLNVIDHPDYPNATGRIVLIPFWMMNTAELEQMGRVKVASQGKEMDEVYLNRLRLVARFPQGLSDELLAVLLAELGQDQVEVPHRTD